MQYFGGKQIISKHISEYINSIERNEYTEYVEIFCGACNVASKVNFENKILNDKHYYLIKMFEELKNGWVPPEIVTKQEYDYIKNNQNECPHLTGFVGFACSFAGKWFGGYARNIKGVDKIRNYALEGKNSVLRKMEGLKDANFICKDFLELSFSDAIIYCDPPYKNTTQYNKKLLGAFPYDDFLQWVNEQSNKNIVLVSEYKHNVPQGAKIVLEIPSRTSIRNKDNKRIDTIECLWTWNDI